MKLWSLSLGALLLLGAAPAMANDLVLKETGNPAQWAAQQGDYANTRFSTLDKINKDNVGDLQVAWTFSTGVLRGHEGSPLVIGDMMYVHTPFPNTIFALDLANEGRIVWKYQPAAGPERHRRDVLRHRLSRPRLCRRACCSCTRPTRRWWRSTPRPAR